MILEFVEKKKSTTLNNIIVALREAFNKDLVV
jgi:hypothetical protein